MADNPHSGRHDTAPLLSELEAIKASLDRHRDLDPAHIPVLDDIIEPSPRLHPTPSKPPQRPGTEETGYEREIFIQSLIDDMLPDIEAALRRRLLAMDKQELERLYRQSQQQD